MISKSKLSLALGLFFLLRKGLLNAQSQEAIVINEYCASNIAGPTDNFGQLSDWVEIFNNHTFSVSLSSYYLSNDPKNLKKWQFPAGTNLQVGGHLIVWLSGKNIRTGEPHTNFTIEQCKKQWLILTSSEGVIRDSVFVQPSQAGHSWGRVDYTFKGIKAWRVYKNPSPLQPNPLINNYKGYMGTPKLIISPPNNPATFNETPNKGGFYEGGGRMGYFKYNGFTYDTINFPCTDIYFTLNGDFPRVGVAGTERYIDSITSSQLILLDQTTMLRFIAVPHVSGSTLEVCPQDVLPSFCETNTYFIDAPHQDFKREFGVLSIALDNLSGDTAWFTNFGSPASTTIHVEYYDNKKQVSEGYGLINRPPQEAWRTKQKGFYVDIDDRYGSGCNFEGNIFNVEGLGTTTRTVFPALHVKAGDIESHSSLMFPSEAGDNNSYGTGIRDVFYQSLAAKYKLNVNPLHIKPIILFVNAKYWGVYDLREIYDKHYENFYNQSSKDSVDLRTFHDNTEGYVKYPDETKSNFGSNFRTKVYNKAFQPNKPLSSIFPLNSPVYYDPLMAELDKSSFIDYLILNNYALNSDLWMDNIAFAKGAQPGKKGSKWHYYLWNMPSIFNFTIFNSGGYNNPYVSPCVLSTLTAVSPLAGNGHGNILWALFNANNGNKDFQLEYKNRFQDLLNGPLKCENINKHLQFVINLYAKEMRCHENPGCEAGPGQFATMEDQWDTNVTRLQMTVDQRCFVVENYFNKVGCYGAKGPHPLTIDVSPAGAGNVKVNTILLNTYPWKGNYFSTTMSFKAIPTNTNFVFHHWEFKNHIPKDPLSMDSVGVIFDFPDDVVAVFTDKTRDIVGAGEGANVPTGFSPNGDGLNDWFRPLGSAEFVSEYQMTVWNRWGQEVYRSVNPTDQGWDGTYKGQPAITGVYAYVITYKNIFGESKLVKGNVTLTR
jgi:gliding motility-associated-like protein